MPGSIMMDIAPVVIAGSRMGAKAMAPAPAATARLPAVNAARVRR